MDILNLSTGGGNSPKKSNKFRAFVGVGVIAAAVVLSSTLAANININSGPVEFGQGVAQTVACSGEESIIVTPSSTFSNEGADISTTFTEAENNWIYVASSAGIGVGMVVDDGEGWIPQDTVVIGFEGERGVLLSSSLSGDTSELASGRVVIFSESRGTPATLTPSESATYGSSDYGSFEIDSSGLSIGMLVTGSGIEPETVVTYVEPGYIETSKENTYSGGALTFANSRSGIQGSFNLSDITVSNIPDTCNGKVFTIKIYDNTSSEPLVITDWGSNDNAFQVYWGNGLFTSGEGYLADSYAMLHFENEKWFTDDRNYGGCLMSGTCIETAHSYDSTIGPNTFRVILPLSIDATRVYKITVESQDDSNSFEFNNNGEITNWSFNEFFWRRID